ncbi:class I SAM-dependent methyltransferase [Mariniphaga sp.]|uniref:class I SAM-dependent methyltransferase n=1 Tax=Mariniphaga sp. TaxID=1954475 RepID=UPI0035686C3A
MSEFWNERYTLKEYVYGTKPNVFFKTQIANLSPGKILFPAEGEGRNAVYAARLGWDVYAFDSSIEARKKAYLLAKDHAVGIKYELNDIETAEYPSDFFDCIVLIFAHFHPFERNYFHNRLLSFLKPGGTIILEGFSKKQLQFSSGGPRTVEMLFSEEEIQNDFKLLSKLELEEAEIILDEGKFHQGSASVIRMVGEK